MAPFEADARYAIILEVCRKDGEPLIANVLRMMDSLGVNYGRFNDTNGTNNAQQRETAAAIDRDTRRAWFELGYTKGI